MVVTFLSRRGGPDPLVATPNSVAVIYPATSEVVAVVPAGTTPTSIVSGGGSVWTLNTGDGTITRIDAADREARGAIPAGYGASDIAFEGGEIWVAHASADVVRILNDVGNVASELRLGIPHAGRRGGTSLAQVALAAGAGQVWAAGGTGTGLTTVVMSARLRRDAPHHRLTRDRCGYRTGRPRDCDRRSRHMGYLGLRRAGPTQRNDARGRAARRIRRWVATSGRQVPVSCGAFA
jgi:hypothetical protein